MQQGQEQLQGTALCPVLQPEKVLVQGLSLRLKHWQAMTASPVQGQGLLQAGASGPAMWQGRGLVQAAALSPVQAQGLVQAIAPGLELGQGQGLQWLGQLGFWPTAEVHKSGVCRECTCHEMCSSRNCRSHKQHLGTWKVTGKPGDWDQCNLFTLLSLLLTRLVFFHYLSYHCQAEVVIVDLICYFLFLFFAILLYYASCNADDKTQCL